MFRKFLHPIFQTIKFPKKSFKDPAKLKEASFDKKENFVLKDEFFFVLNKTTLNDERLLTELFPLPAFIVDKFIFPIASCKQNLI